MLSNPLQELTAKTKTENIAGKIVETRKDELRKKHDSFSDDDINEFDTPDNDILPYFVIINIIHILKVGWIPSIIVCLNIRLISLSAPFYIF